jgi:moderate conductance mechanosensitive channel
MWGWLINKSLWFLLAAALLMLLLLFLNEKARSMAAGLVKEKKIDGAPDSVKEKKRSGVARVVNTIFWILETVAALVMVASFILMTFSEEGTPYMLTGESIKNWIWEHGVRIVLIVIISIVLLTVLKRFLPSLMGNFMAYPVRGESKEGIKKRSDTLLGVFLGLGRVVIILIGVLMILSELNVPVGPVLAGFGIVGVAVGFGAQYMIRDLIAGVFLLMENQYRVGDVASVGGVNGLVEMITLRKTVLRDIDGIVHHVPNGEIRVASNYSRHFSRVNLNISVAYNTDLEHAIKVINGICNTMAEEERWGRVFKSIPQVLRVDKLGDSGIDIKITGDVKPLEQWNVMGELRIRLKKAFEKEGIEIPWPHTKVYFGNKPG